MKTIIAVAILAVGLTAGAVSGRARAETVWHYPYKGVPYVTETTPTVREYRAPRRYSQYRLFRNLAGENNSQDKARC